MYVWNQTVLVAHSIEASWLDWIITEYLPAARSATACSGDRLLQLLDVDEEHGASYAIQLEWTEQEQFRLFMEGEEAILTDMMNRRWGPSALAFNTTMKVVN